VSAGIGRRDFGLALAGLAAPLACARREPETPLAHLYGRDWVRGAYGQYASAYADVQARARDRTFDSYRLLSQRGITALEALQAREVPFHLRVRPDAPRFAIERELPERLTFTAGMSAAERAEATRIWKLGRDNIHRDYDEIRRLEHALTTLLDELGHVRVAIDQGRVEQFRIARQLSELAQGGALPFALPYQVSREDYTSILLLLLERLEDDGERLRRVEASMVAVGLVARATDAGSASLAPNVRKVLLAIAQDSEQAAGARPAVYPEAREQREPLVARARALHATLISSEDYRAWLAAEREREDQLGKFLAVLDQVTGLGVSAVYRQVLRIWQGEGDYLGYLRLAAALVPHGSGVSGVLQAAVESTERYRDLVSSADRARAVFEAAGRSQSGTLEIEGALLNVGTRQARTKLDRQLVFFRDAGELEQVSQELSGSLLGGR
jgi:hypothetical protein